MNATTRPTKIPTGELEQQPVEIQVNESTRVSGIFIEPPQATACYVVAHGAGAGMRHPFMERLADGLAARQIATLRYQFPYMEKHSKRPDTPKVCHATVRAAVHAARALTPALPLLAGGKSFGGRMTSQAQSMQPLPDVHGLAFLGFPLHPPQQPAESRAAHLAQVHIPMLFLQGARDAFADPALLYRLITRLGQRATSCVLPDADHSFHVPARSTCSDPQIHHDMLNAFASWAERVTRA